MKKYCDVCTKQYYPQRKSAKYCSESCKQRAKYMRMNDMFFTDLNDAFNTVSNKLSETFDIYFDDKHNPDALLDCVEDIENIQFILSKMMANIATIEIEQQNTWYQCNNCGQKTFGRVEKCDFCNENDFKRIKLV